MQMDLADDKREASNDVVEGGKPEDKIIFRYKEKLTQQLQSLGTDLPKKQKKNQLLFLRCGVLVAKQLEVVYIKYFSLRRFPQQSVCDICGDCNQSHPHLSIVHFRWLQLRRFY